MAEQTEQTLDQQIDAATDAVAKAHAAVVEMRQALADAEDMDAAANALVKANREHTAASNKLTALVTVQATNNLEQHKRELVETVDQTMEHFGVQSDTLFINFTTGEVVINGTLRKVRTARKSDGTQIDHKNSQVVIQKTDGGTETMTAKDARTVYIDTDSELSDAFKSAGHTHFAVPRLLRKHPDIQSADWQ